MRRARRRTGSDPLRRGAAGTNDHLIPHKPLERRIDARVRQDSDILSLFIVESRFDNSLEK